MPISRRSYRGIVRLTGFSDVGLRILLRLAVLEPGRRIATRDVAEQMRLSYAHATKACAHLSERGWIDADRGRGGGLSLTDEGRGARIGQVIRSLEGDDGVELIDCAGLDCPLQPACRLRRALAQASAAFYSSLDAVTVTDLARPPTRALITALTEGSDLTR